MPLYTNDSPRRARRTPDVRILAGLSALSLGLLCFTPGCSPDHREATIREVRTVKQAPPKLGASDADRFGFQSPQSQAQPTRGSLDYTLPQGWGELPPKQFRDINLQAPGEVAAWVTIMGPQHGLPNVQRWYGQMGLSGPSQAEYEALPKLPMLDGQSLVVDLVDPKGERRMIARMLLSSTEAIFVRCNGPKAAVDAQAKNFDLFCDSLRRGKAATAQMPPDAAHGGAATAGTGGSRDGMSWDTPEGWGEKPGSSFRTASFEVDEATEAWISVLVGDGGGLSANVARWARQVGLPAPAADEIGGYPTFQMMGSETLWIELFGESEGLIVAVCWRPAIDRTVYIRLKGSPEKVVEHRDAFRRFCESFESEEG